MDELFSNLVDSKPKYQCYLCLKYFPNETDIDTEYKLCYECRADVGVMAKVQEVITYTLGDRTIYQDIYRGMTLKVRQESTPDKTPEAIRLEFAALSLTGDLLDDHEIRIQALEAGSGSSGTIGESGTSGTSGASGYKGDSGTSGTSGAIGYSGTSGTSGTGPSYTNANPSVITVGGIDSGTTFNDVDYPEFVDMLLYPELFPVLTNPSSTFTSTYTGYLTIGQLLASITFNSAFNRGSIVPQYTSASQYRSGSPNQYTYTGTDLSNQTTSSLTDSQTITNYTVVSGAQSWTGRVAYDAGVQPKGSKDSDYDSPLAAGSTSIVTNTIIGVYPYFATTVDITTKTQQTLTSMSSTYVQTNVVAESGSDKQTVDLPVAWSAITGIQFYNTVSSTWEWINGSKANSLLVFTVTSVTYLVQGSLISYNRYTHNGSTTGARYLRWYTT